MSLVHHFTFLHWHLTTFFPFNRLANFFRNILTFFFVCDATDFILDVSAFLFINRNTLLLCLFIIAVFVWFFHLDGSRWTFFTLLTNFLAIGSRNGFGHRSATPFRNFFAFAFWYLKTSSLLWKIKIKSNSFTCLHLFKYVFLHRSTGFFRHCFTLLHFSFGIFSHLSSYVVRHRFLVTQC